jgi:threonylcarbamoyladenosine tRNA methylthiotransferase MtaB
MPGQVANKTKRPGWDIIRIGEKSGRNYIQKFIGKEVEVLIEKISADGTAQGHTRNFLKLKLRLA